MRKERIHSTESLFGTGCALVALLAAWRGSEGEDREAWGRRLDVLVADLESRRRDDGLLALNARAGHGAGKPTSMRIDEVADRLAFLAWALGDDSP